MIDPADGTILFVDPPFSLSPATTQTAFLASAVGRSATEFCRGAMDYMSYKVARAVCSGKEFIVVPWFKGERLYRITLAWYNPRSGKSWAEWSLEHEMAGKTVHDEWLAAVLPDGADRPWGTVRSIYSERDCESRIDIDYGPK
jgi:hypothetical protein